MNLKRVFPGIVSVASLFLFIACERPPQKAATVAETLNVDSRILLVESDTAFIGRPIGFAVSNSSEFYVSDGFSRRVLRFDSTGHFRQAIGRQGNGPDEFGQPALLVAVDDTTLLVSDDARRDFVVWNVNANKSRLRFPNKGSQGVIAVDGDNILATSIDYGNGTIARRWKFSNLESQQFGRLPRRMNNPRIGVIWGRIPLEAKNDTVVFVTGDRDVVQIASGEFVPYDSITIPKRVRRGIPDVIDSTVGGGRTIYDVMRQLSSPYAVHKLSGDRIAVIHFDATVEKSLVTGPAYLTVVSKSGAPRCVDRQLPTHEGAIPRITFRADTLYVLDQFANGTRATTEISKIVLSSAVC